jgi:hypothetical protein
MMSETSSPSQPVRRFDLPRLLSIFTKPRQAFTELASGERASWSIPMLVLTVSAILVVLVSGFMQTRAASQAAVELPPDWEFWTPEMQDNFMQAQQATQGPMFTYVLPLLGSLFSLWLGWFVFSGILHLTSTILGGRGSMRGALNVVAWASMPYLIRDLLRIVFMVIAGHAIVSPGLSGFAGESGFLSSLLARTDLFLFWYILLLGIGVAISEGLPRGKAYAGVIFIVLVVLLIQAGVGGLGSSFGLSAISRPYF